jgi:hypothetical protein
MAKAYLIYEYDRTHEQLCPDNSFNSDEPKYENDLYKCLVCDTWYVGVYGDYGKHWTKVRWYHLQAKKRIKALDT